MSDYSDNLGPALSAVIELGHTARLPVFGNSMRPLLRSGDVVYVAPPPEALRVGAVVARNFDGQLLVHRVVRAHPLATKGDSVGDFDPPEAALIGEVVGIERCGKRVPLHPQPLAALLSRLLRPAQAWLARRRARAGVLAAPLTRPSYQQAYAALGEIALAFHEQAIDLAVLKGAASAMLLYARPAHRPFGDIDLLVRPEDFGRAEQQLTKMGFTPASRPAGNQRDYARAGILVELHCDLINNPRLRGTVRIDPAELWTATQPATLCGAAVRVLGPEHAIVHMGVHMAGHYFYAPRTLQDLVRALSSHAPDWERLVALAEWSNAKAITYAGLWLARGRGAAVPQAALDRLAPRRRAVLDWLLPHLAKRDGAINRPALLLFMDRPIDVARAIRATLLPKVGTEFALEPGQRSPDRAPQAPLEA